MIRKFLIYCGFVLASFCFLAYGLQSSNQKSYEEVTNQFNRLELSDLVEENFSNEFVYIGRKTCPFCQQFINELQQNPTYETLPISYLDTQTERGKPELKKMAEHFQLEGIPTFMYFDENHHVTIFHHSESLEQFISSHQQ